MMGIYFQYPFLLILLPFIIGIVIYFWYIQNRAMEDVSKLSHYTKWMRLTSLMIPEEENTPRKIRFIIFMICILISMVSLGIGIASPFSLGDSEVLGRQRNVYIAIDGSWSMRAGDHMFFPEEYSLKGSSRFGEAQVHATEVSNLLEDFNIGVLTFGQNPVQHTYPHPDKEWVKKVILQTNLHNIFYSGNNIKGLLEQLISNSRFSPQGFQIVIYSDGDILEEEEKAVIDYLPIIKRMSVPIHVVAVGSDKGRNLTMSYNRLVKENVAPKSGGSDKAGQRYKTTENVVVQEKLSQVKTDFLQSLAEETGGFFVATKDGRSGIGDLVTAIENNKDKSQTLIWEATGRKDLSYYFLIFPLLVFFLDGIFLRRGSKK